MNSFFIEIKYETGIDHEVQKGRAYDCLQKFNVIRIVDNNEKSTRLKVINNIISILEVMKKEL